MILNRLFLTILACLMLASTCIGSNNDPNPVTPSNTQTAGSEIKKDVTEVVIIGTMHGFHNESIRYTSKDLKQILLSLKPSVICVELPSKFDKTIIDELAKNPNYPDLGMPVEVASNLGVKLVPFDDENRDDYYRDTNYFERQKAFSKVFDTWLAELEKREAASLDTRLAEMAYIASATVNNLSPSDSPEQINSGRRDSSTELKHKFWNEVIPEVMARRDGDKESLDYLKLNGDYWQKRNSIMANNIDRIAADYRGKRIVVTTGAEHRYILRQLLAKNQRIVLKEFWEILPSKKEDGDH